MKNRHKMSPELTKHILKEKLDLDFNKRNVTKAIDKNTPPQKVERMLTDTTQPPTTPMHSEKKEHMTTDKKRYIQQARNKKQLDKNKTMKFFRREQFTKKEEI